MGLRSWFASFLQRSMRFEEVAEVEAAMSAREVTTVEDRPGWDWFRVEPKELFPRALEYIAEMLRGDELVPSYLADEMMRASRLSPEAWRLARQHGETCPPDMREVRAVALEHARRVFTAILRVEHGGPIALHIVKDPTGQWKL